MSNSSSTVSIEATRLVSNAILLDLSPEELEDEAKEILEYICELIGSENYKVVVKYIITQVASQLLSSSESPLFESINSVLTDMNSEFVKMQDTVGAEVRRLKEENSHLKSSVTSLASETNTTNSSLSAVRRRLKNDQTKQDLGECQKIRKKGNKTEIEELALRLAEAIKDVCCSIKHL